MLSLFCDLGYLQIGSEGDCVRSQDLPAAIFGDRLVAEEIARINIVRILKPVAKYHPVMERSLRY